MDALLNADIVGPFLTLGGDQAFLCGYTPEQPATELTCTIGGNMLFSRDNDGNITHRFASYLGAQLLTQVWLGESVEFHELYPVALHPRPHPGDSLLTAYAVYRPDGLWSLLIISKDSRRAYRVNVEFLNMLTGITTRSQTAIELYQFSGENYQLSAEKSDPYPVRFLPPTHQRLDKNGLKTVVLPSYSLSVLRKAGPNPQSGCCHICCFTSPLKRSLGPLRRSWISSKTSR